MFEITCGKCGAPIYSGVDLKPAKDMLKLVSNRCKKCGALLSDQDFIVEVKPLQT
ncbi:MAG: hypothetical protein HYU39_01760 [Thaumarchaeota archaeon]|nr:hypothetical protein [Nitrososphaerota archaeon]